MRCIFQGVRDGALLFVVLFVVVFAGLHRPQPQPDCCSPANIERDVIATYVQIGDEATGCGSGVVIWHGGKTRVLTASHVAKGIGDDVPLFKYAPHVRHEWKGRLLARSVAPVDLALYDVANAEGLATAMLATYPATPGDELHYIGTPVGLHSTLERTIASTFAVRDEHTFLQYNGCGFYGSSGGGVFKREGKFYALCGITVRLAYPDMPKSPLLCEQLADIRAFLDGVK